jgi:probable phosphoglycerate mutase
VAARAMRVVEAIRFRHPEGNVLIVSHKATLRIITCALLGLDVRLFRERIAEPVSAVTMFKLTKMTALLTLHGDRSHLSEELKNQEGT